MDLERIVLQQGFQRLLRSAATDDQNAAGARNHRAGGEDQAAGDVKKEALETLLKDDPFQVHGLADYKVTEFKAGKLNPVLAELA